MIPELSAALFNWLEDSQLAVTIRQSLWLYPSTQAAHIVGIVMLVGPAMLFDLRLLGFMRSLSVSDLKRYTLPWSKAGFIITVFSGLLLFIAHATDWGIHTLFWIKLFLIFCAVLNAFIFSRYITKKIERLHTLQSIPFSAKLSGIISLNFWLLIIIAGRFLAYY